MNEHDATEISFKNGYKKGAVDAVHKMQSEIESRCIEKGIYPVIVKRVVDEVAKEIVGGENDGE